MNSLLMNPAKDQLPKLFLPGCTECEKTEAILTNSVSARRRYSAPYFNIRAIGIPDVAGESVDASLHSRIHIGALVDTNAVQVTWADGPPTNKTPGNSFSLSMDLAWRDDRWFVVSFEDHDISSVEP